jgi:hypothetical protein
MTPLEELLDTLDRAASPDDAPFLVAAFGAAHDGGVLVTDGDVSHLLGWRVPPECWAVGLIGAGNRIPLHSTLAEEEAADSEHQRMRLCCLVGRDGAVATLLRAPDGAGMASGDAGGRVIDALRRALGLPTPPPEEDTAQLLAILWIDELLAAVDSGVILGWPAAAGLHPAMRALASEGHDIAPEHITMIARVATAAWSWENLRLQACQEDWLRDLIPAELAEWMDEGMFARWMLAGLPPFAAVSNALSGALAPKVWSEVLAVMAATGVATDGGNGDAEGPTSRRDECQRHATPAPAPRPRATRRN